MELYLEKDGSLIARIDRHNFFSLTHRSFDVKRFGANLSFPLLTNRRPTLRPKLIGHQC